MIPGPARARTSRATMAGLPPPMRALSTAEEDALRRALGELHPCPPATILRAAEKTLGRPEGSLDARQMLVTAFCNAEMSRIDDLKRAVAPPSLAFGDKGLVVTFTPPSEVSHAALYLHVDGDKLFYDGDKKKLLAPGELGNALAARPRRPNKIVVDGRLKGGKPITATVCYRGPAAFAFSPESAHSNSVVAALPLVPGAPLVQPYTAGGVKVHFVAPPRCFKVAIRVVDTASGDVYRVEWNADKDLYDCLLGLTGPGTSRVPIRIIEVDDHTRQSTAKIRLRAHNIEYAISLAAFNGVAWSEFGPASTINLADHVPLVPCAPLIDTIGEDNAMVRFSPPPSKLSAHGSQVVLAFRVRGAPADATRYFDSNTLELVSGDYARDAVGLLNPKKHGRAIRVRGLAAATEYDVTVIGANTFGWSAHSPATTFKTLPGEVEVTGVQTQDERDAEAKKRAVDVDADDSDEPEAKRPARKKRRQ